MSTKPSAALAAAMSRDAQQSVPEDKLEAVRKKLREFRDQQQIKAGLEERLKQVNIALFETEHKTLPDLFNDVGIDKLGLPAEGNLPAYDADLSPYYKASISAEWPEEKRAEAFKWLDDNNHGDIIKSAYVILLPRGARTIALALEKAIKGLKARLPGKKTLQKVDVDYVVKLEVPWNTLTAFVKEQVEKGEAPPLDVLGATVGEIVKLKPRKEK